MHPSRAGQTGRRYEAVLRLSEALSLCTRARGPDEDPSPNSCANFLGPPQATFLTVLHHCVQGELHGSRVGCGRAREEPRNRHTRMCQLNSGHRGRHIPHRNRSTLLI